MSLIVCLIYTTTSQIRFASSDCTFQGIRTPNAQTRILREANVYKKLGDNDMAGYRIRMSRGDKELAMIWKTRADLEYADEASDKAFVKATYKLYLAGCGPAPAAPSDLHYLTSDQ